MITAIDQKSIHGCVLQLEDSVLKQASLFPFFDDEGLTRALMLVSRDSSRIELLDFKPDLFTRRWVWLKELRHSVANGRDCSADDAEHRGGLWHYDPWWVLGEERFAGHPAVPPLKGTNLPGYDSPIHRMWFAPDLSRVTWVAVHGAEGLGLERFSPKHLAPARQERGPNLLPAAMVAGSRGWQLRPWW